MINLLRRIRQKLIDKGKVKNYLLYAFGEVVLIVIGILIALQINNWNTNKSNRLIEYRLLEGIKSDLIQDTLQVRNRFLYSYKRLKNSISRFDSIISLDDDEINMEYIDSIFGRCTRQRNTFWPITGTYQSIVNNGSSNLINNDSLFKKIQNQYDKNYEIIKASGNRIDVLSDKIKYKVKDYKTMSESDRLRFYREKATRNEIEYWFLQLTDFRNNLLGINNRSEQIISEIDKELNQRH